MDVIAPKKDFNLNSYSDLIVFVKDRPGHDQRYALNSELFKSFTRYKMKVNLRSGLNETINWYIKNKNWLKKTKTKYKYKRLGLND